MSIPFHSLFPKNNTWKSFALSIGADFIDGGFLHSDQINIHRNFYSINIRLGTNQRGNAGFMYTRFRCAYTSLQPLYFKIKKRGWFSSLFSYKQKQRHAIEQKYIISSNGLGILLSQKELWRRLDQLHSFKFVSEKDDGLYGPAFNTNEHQLCLEILRELKDSQHLTNAIAIIDETMLVLLQSGHLIPQKLLVAY